MLTVQQNTDFFTNQMNIPARTVTELATMGIDTAESLVDYDEDLLKQVKEDLKRPGGTEVDPNNAAARIPTRPYVLSPLSCHRLAVAAHAVRYYNAIGRGLTMASMTWNGALMMYAEYLKALKVQKKAENPELPKVSRSLPVVQWTEAFSIYLDRTLGSRDIPLSYVIRENEVPPVIQNLQNRRPYSTNHSSVNEELIARASHTHELFSTDNQYVFDYIEEALRTTAYSATLAGFKRAKNGRGAWFAIIAQYVGKDKWQKDIKVQERFLHSFVWTGHSTQTLEAFINKHRVAFVKLQRCAENVTYTLPSDSQRVQYLLDGIRTSDGRLQAAIANVLADDDPTGKLHNFESAAAYIVPHDPVASKRPGNKRKQHEIAAVDLGITRGPKTGVDIRYYENDEFKKLTQDERDELVEIRRINSGESSNAKKKQKKNKKKKNGGKNNGKGNTTFDIAALTTKVIASIDARVQKQENEQAEKQASTAAQKVLVAALDQLKVDSSNTADEAKMTAKSTRELKEIIDRSKRN